jgi:hypothetical protein
MTISKLNTLRLSLLAMAVSTAAVSAKAAPYASASSCSADCGCNGGDTSCCVLANGALCGLTPVKTVTE